MLAYNIKCAVLGLCFFAVFAVVTNAAAVTNERRAWSDIPGDITSIVGTVTSVVAGEVKSELSDIKSVGTEIETIAGSAVTVLTAEGGVFITLAESGVGGIVTSIAGAEYTIAFAAGNFINGAALGVSTPLLGGLFTMIASVVLGVCIAL